MKEIEFKNVNYNVNNQNIIENLSFQIDKGEMVSIVGESGKGKSTVLNLISGLLTPTSGKVIVCEVENPDYRKEEGRKLLNQNLSFIFQNFVLLDNITVEENFDLVKKYFKSNIDYKEILNKVGLNEEILKKKVYMLSGGEQQRVAIARNLLKKSNIILADEPTGSLDNKNRDVILKLLKELQQEGNTVVIVTHDKYVKEFCDRSIEL